MKFEYSIPENVEIGEESGEKLCVSKEPNDKEVIVFQKDKNGKQMILANKDGWRFLAKICLEMSFLSEKDPGFHIHRNGSFEFSKNDKDENIGLFNISSSLEKQVLEKRQKYN